jgi:hypothetical protein
MHSFTSGHRQCRIGTRRANFGANLDARQAGTTLTIADRELWSFASFAGEVVEMRVAASLASGGEEVRDAQEWDLHRLF